MTTPDKDEKIGGGGGGAATSVQDVLPTSPHVDASSSSVDHKSLVDTPSREDASDEQAPSYSNKYGGISELLGLGDRPPPAQVAWTGKRSWFRSTFTQATILGMCSFLSPGLWGALAALGAGGSQNVSTVNAANSLTFGLMVLTAAFTSALVNVTSIKFALIFGTMGYAPYAAGLYLNSKTGAQWLVIFGAACCGVSAGVFWSAEGAIILAYPERRRQARYISYWLMFRVLGQLLGGIINLSLNANNSEAGSISLDTYLVFVILQCLAPFCAMLLSPPHRVQRTDKTPVYLNINTSTRNELCRMWKTVTSPKVLLLLPMIWQGTWSEALIGTYAAIHFTVRSRALGSLLSAVCASLCNYALGFYLDWKRPAINTRAKSAFLAVYSLQAGLWIWAIYIMHEYTETKPTLDWTSDGYGRGFALYIFLQVGFNMMYEYVYFLIGHINDDPGEIVRIASVVRGIESAGQAVSYGVNSTGLRLDAVAGINMAQWAICLVPAWLVIRKLGILADGTRIHEARIYAPEEKREALKKSGIREAEHDGTGDVLERRQ
ncbi:uncharacterized protein PFL1_04372 [Pseudozyma flocculosa PF-1]|uniref:Related to DUF895 domain membrane protein n=2 Tax=Pseudozyma flocculosa TaxID=84751 RepID=A0A5C3FD75_9BASI|nr:uncharacterized protein PFL1_04372 [Pseudozyma flocculosa PF-1]EPQ28045.1 hypothetical protein PFL1_04372 [Pseudozyma flocculosa PF-1]SPO42220.1 related to DUF895 domain membrane protein [Pseudozyma flocculosa]